MVLGFFERRDGLVARHGREVVEELVEGTARFEVVEKGFHWHACPHEYDRSVEDLRVAVDDAFPGSGTLSLHTSTSSTFGARSMMNSNRGATSFPISV